MQRMTGDVIVARGGSALMEAQTGDEMVALDIESGTCYGFNATAHRIWQLIERPMPLSRLCDILSEEFDVDPETSARDVRALLEDLAQDGLVTLSSPA